MPLRNFPTYTSRFIGRESDATSVAQAIQAHQLVSLIGTSGTGKTRLSQQIAQQLEANFADGCVFVSLAAITNPNLVVSTIALNLGINLVDETLPLNQLQETLAPQQLLLVLDNVEQVIEAAPALVVLLEQCPQIHMLMTSQEPLRVEQEVVIRIPPLDIPPTTQDYTVQELLAFPAIALFIDRLKITQPHFQLTQQNLSLVKEICQRLYGLPLALELVAANSRQMPLRDVLLLLKNYLPALDTGVPLRRSDIIQPVLDWCYRIMPPALQRVYPQLGVFHGGWTQATAEQVCEIVHPGWSIESVHRWLGARHLVLTEELADGSERYSMVDAVVEDTRRRLEAVSNNHNYFQRHAQTFEQFATHAGQQAQQGESAVAWFDQLEHERANMRAALEWTLHHEQLPLAACLAIALSRFWMTRGDVREAQSWYKELLSHQAELEAEHVAGLQYGAGLMDILLGNHQAAQTAWETSLAWYEAQNDEDWMARLWNNLAALASLQNKFAQARHWLEQAQVVHQQAGRSYQEARILGNIGLLYAREGRAEEALQAYQENRVLVDRIDAKDMLPTLIGNMGCCYVQLQDYVTAIPLLEESLELHRTFNQPLAHTMSRHLATAYLRLNQPELAHSTLVTSFKDMLATHNNLEITYGLEALAEWFLRLQQPEQAREAWHMATITRAQLAMPRRIHNQDNQQLVEDLDQLAKDSAQPTSFDQAIFDQTVEQLLTFLQTHPYAFKTDENSTNA